MRLFATLILEMDTGKAGAEQMQAAARGLTEAGFADSLDGRKGAVQLPKGSFARIVEVTPAEGEKASQVIGRTRRTVADDISKALGDAHFAGTFFLTLGRSSAWAFRPIPRYEKESEESRTDFAIARTTATGLTAVDDKRPLAAAIRAATKQG
jgi:hypothetical protein